MASKQGFGSMDEQKQREIASKGGKAAHAQGKAHEFSSEDAREQGAKGGGAAHESGKAHEFSSEEAVKQVEREASKVKDETSSTKPYASSQSHPFTTRASATYGVMWQGRFSA